MLKLIVRFPQMEAEKKQEIPKIKLGEKTDWEKFELAWAKSAEKAAECQAKEAKAMSILEETAFALSMERVRRKSGTVGYFSDHIGLHPDYSNEKGGFVIRGDYLYPELIDSLESLEELGAFEMHFEDESGKQVRSDWWRDEDEWELYDPDDYRLDNFMEEKMAEATA